MVEAYNNVGGNIIAAMDVPPEHTKRYGVIKPGKNSDRLVEVTGLVEKPTPAEAPSNTAVIGRSILQPRVFHHPDNPHPGAGGHMPPTDALAKPPRRGPPPTP